MKNKVLALILSVIIIFSFATKHFASENNNEYTIQNFNKAKSEGLIDEEISYEQWIDFVEKDNILDYNKTFLYNNPNFTLKKGDILITNSPIPARLIGHTGIAISESEIIHITGYGEIPEVISFSDWLNAYDNPNKWTKIYRLNNYSIAKNAGDWAKYNYKNKDYKYGISGNINSLSPTYCSKIVWQAYHNEGGENIIKTPVGIIIPYDLPNHFKGKYSLSLIKTIYS